MRVLIVDGHPVSASGLAAILREESFEIVGVATTLKEALSLSQAPETAVMDPSTLEEGARAIRVVAEKYPGIRIAVLTASENPNHVYDATRSGARAYFFKRIPLTSLVSALHLMATGDLVIGPNVVASVMPLQSGDPLDLADNERHLLSLVAEGAHNSEIANRMAMSEATFKRRLHEVERKLHARNRIEAVIRATKLGLI